MDQLEPHFRTITSYCNGRRSCKRLNNVQSTYRVYIRSKSLYAPLHATFWASKSLAPQMTLQLRPEGNVEPKKNWTVQPHHSRRRSRWGLVKISNQQETNKPAAMLLSPTGRKPANKLMAATAPSAHKQQKEQNTRSLASLAAPQLLATSTLSKLKKQDQITKTRERQDEWTVAPIAAPDKNTSLLHRSKEGKNNTVAEVGLCDAN